jgi:hypothetical protein
MRLPVHPRLPSTPFLNLFKPNNTPGLNSQVILPSSLGRKIYGRIGLCGPQIPDSDVLEVFTGDGNTGFPCILENDGLVDTEGRIDAVCFVGDGDGVRIFSDDFVSLGFILVCASLKAGDRGLGYILFLLMAISAGYWLVAANCKLERRLTGRDI